MWVGLEYGSRQPFQATCFKHSTLPRCSQLCLYNPFPSNWSQNWGRWGRGPTLSHRKETRVAEGWKPGPYGRPRVMALCRCVTGNVGMGST